MNFVEHIRIGLKCTKAGIGAKQDRPSAVFDTRKVGWICIAEDPPAESNEILGMEFLVPKYRIRNIYHKCTIEIAHQHFLLLLGLAMTDQTISLPR